MLSARSVRRSVWCVPTVALLVGCSTDTFTDGDSGSTDAAGDSTLLDGSHDDAADASDDGADKKDGFKVGGFTCGSDTCLGTQYCETTTQISSDGGVIGISYQCPMLPMGCPQVPDCSCLGSLPTGCICTAGTGSNTGDLTVTCVD